MSIRRIPVAVLSIIVFIMLISPTSNTPSAFDFEHADKIVHALMFAVLAVASRYGRISPARTALWLTIFAAVTELAQAALPTGRHGSLWDFVADVLAVAMVLAIDAVIRRAQSS